MYKKTITFILCIVMALSMFVYGEVYAEDELTGQVTGLWTLSMEPESGVIFYSLTADDGITAENANYGLYLDKVNGIVKVLDKSNGYIWSSSPYTEYERRISDDWRRFTQSLAVIEYITDTGSIRRSLSKQSDTHEYAYEMLDDGFTVALDFGDAGISLKMTVRLTDKGITAEVSDESISYTGTNVISKLYIMPFMGATHEDDIPGYIFVPDGCGALIRFAASRNYGSSYTGRIYGSDYSISGGYTQPARSTLDVSMQQIYMPVFGIVHGNKENAFLAVIESGEEFCEIEASPAGNIIDYFWGAPKFIYHELYWQPTGGGNGFNTATIERNIVNAKVSYNFLSGEDADYVGMANFYKESLIEKGVLNKKTSDGDIPVKLDAIMAEQKKTLLGSSAFAMTQTQDISRWINSLNLNGIRNIIVSLAGAEKGGISGQKIGTFSIEGKIGGESGLNKLYSDVSSAGAQITLQSNYSSGYEHQIPISKSIYSMNGSFVTEIIPKPLYSTKRYMNLVSLEDIASKMAKQKNYKSSRSIDGLGYTLFSDYRSGAFIHRDEAKERFINILGKFAENTDLLLLESPNEYAFKYAEMVYNTPDTNSMQIYQSDAVPFYQIVLSGYVEMFTPYLNYRSNSVTDILKIIDYNMYPAYQLTEKYSNEFAKTNIVDIYSSRFDDWEELILSQHQMVNDVLKNVRGQEIVSRTVVADNVAAVKYSGGGTVVVNYSNRPYVYEGVIVEALSGMFVKGD